MEDPLDAKVLGEKIDGKVRIILYIPGVVHPEHHVSDFLLIEDFNEALIHVLVILWAPSHFLYFVWFFISQPFLAFNSVDIRFKANEDEDFVRGNLLDCICVLYDFVIFSAVGVLPPFRLRLDTVDYNASVLDKVSLLRPKILPPLGPEASVDLQGHPIEVLKVVRISTDVLINRRSPPYLPIWWLQIWLHVW